MPKRYKIVVEYTNNNNDTIIREYNTFTELTNDSNNIGLKITNTKIEDEKLPKNIKISINEYIKEKKEKIYNICDVCGKCIVNPFSKSHLNSVKHTSKLNNKKIIIIKNPIL